MAQLDQIGMAEVFDHSDGLADLQVQVNPYRTFDSGLAPLGAFPHKVSAHVNVAAVPRGAVVVVAIGVVVL